MGLFAFLIHFLQFSFYVIIIVSDNKHYQNKVDLTLGSLNKF